MNGKILTLQEYIERCKKFNPDYDYSEINFTTISGKYVTPICKKHGKFEINAAGLMKKHICCPECKREERFNTFVEKAKKIHGDKYIYDISTYQNNKTPMNIICPTHGIFKQAPGDHLKGWGCSKCSGKYKPSTEEWINKVAPVYNYKYDYSKVKYIDNKTPVTVICPKHGEFYPIPNNHLKGESGCPKCAAELRHYKFAKTTEQFIADAKAIHGDKYDYGKVDYYNKETKVCIICPEHGEFWQIPNSHLSGYGCPACKLKNQGLLYSKIRESFPSLTFYQEFSPEWLNNQRFDIYCKDENFAIEYDGEQHYYPINHFGGEDNFRKVQERDTIKNNKCINNKCKLFRVKYGYSKEDFDNLILNIKEYIKSRDKYIPIIREGGKITII